MGDRIGYGRVSTHGQKEDTQLIDLKAAGCVRVFCDKGVSGKLASRPELDRCLDHLRKGDTLVITRLSRIARNLRHLLDLADQLQAEGIDLVVLKQGIDTSTPAGRLMFHMFGAFDEFLRELIVEGTLEGLAATTARGRNGGRKPKLSAAQVKVAQGLIDSKAHNVTEVAAILGVSRATLYRALEKASDKLDEIAA